MPPMPEKFLRIYKRLDFHNVKNHLLLYGALSGSCAGCKAMDIKLDSPKCPHCHSDFKYIAFQNVKDHMPKILRISHERPEIVFVDYDDYKRTEGAVRAEELLK